ncbi:MAG: hypothetical protein HUK13_03305 [Muribaculaceae bacterium]|nr:hypothetical protein [Muribaculaceae bacterium]
MKKILLILSVFLLCTAGVSAKVANKANLKQLAKKEAINDVRREAKRASGLKHKIYYEAPEGDTKLFSEAFAGLVVNPATYMPEAGYNDGWVVEVVYCENNEVYIKNFDASGGAMGSYIRGTIDGDKIVCKTWQCIAGYNDEWDAPAPMVRAEEEEDEWTFGKDGTYFYFAPVRYDDSGEEPTYVADRTIETFTLAVDGDKMKLELPEGVSMSTVFEDGEWMGMTLDRAELTLFTDTAIEELPEGLTPERWVLAGATDARFVEVAISGNDIYVGNINSDLPAYIKGSINGDKVTFPTNQYLGIDYNYNYFTYIASGKWGTYVDPYTGDSYEDYCRTSELVLSYDSENKVMSSADDEGLFVNEGTADFIYYLEMYAPVTLKWQDPAFVPNVPKDPVFVDVYYDEDIACNICDFELPKTDVDGNLLDVNNMYYNFFCDGEVFTFYSDEYWSLEFDGIEELTDVPYTFSDAFSFYIVGGEKPAHSLIYFFEGADSIGLQLFYKVDDDNVLASNVVKYDFSSIANVESNAEVVATSYFNLSGQCIAKPANGFYIKVDKLSDGSQRAMKCVK